VALKAVSDCVGLGVGCSTEILLTHSISKISHDDGMCTPSGPAPCYLFALPPCSTVASANAMDPGRLYLLADAANLAL
jgi:hypothetical protein